MASNVERELEWLLITRIMRYYDSAIHDKLVDRDGALNSFYAKNYLGIAFALYEKRILNNLEIVRRIRNVFAHAAAPLSFSADSIAKECMKLSITDTDAIKIPDGVDLAVPRDRFILSCFVLLVICARKRSEILRKYESDEIGTDA
jgi:hypothetical protein